MRRKHNIRYLCVDDEPDIESTRRRLSRAGGIPIDLSRPIADWTGEVAAVHKAMTSNKYAGLLIDFRLDETHQGKKTKTEGMVVQYTAESLVSELRRRSVEGGKDESYPIVLWSTAKFLTRFYELNPAYMVSYDAIWDKEQLVKEMATYGQKLTALARGYQQIMTALSKHKAGMDTLLQATDMSILGEFDQFMLQKAQGNGYAFQYALFIMHDVLEVRGPLIDAVTLQAFLGVDRWRPVDWRSLLSKLDDKIMYRGVFSPCYKRFWRQRVLERLDELADPEPWLSLPAEERVALLKKFIKGAQIKAAKPLHKDYSTDYDCVCAVTFRPLAKRNGFRLLDPHPLPWKDASYAAGVSYRLKFSELSKTLPLETEEKERFATQFGV